MIVGVLIVGVFSGKKDRCREIVVDVHAKIEVASTRSMCQIKAERLIVIKNERKRINKVNWLAKTYLRASNVHSNNSKQQPGQSITQKIQKSEKKKTCLELDLGVIKLDLVEVSTLGGVNEGSSSGADRLFQFLSTQILTLALPAIFLTTKVRDLSVSW